MDKACCGARIYGVAGLVKGLSLALSIGVTLFAGSPAQGQEPNATGTSDTEATTPLERAAANRFRMPFEAPPPLTDAAGPDASSVRDEGADLAYGLYQRGLYLSAFAVATRLALENNAASQTLLGELYRFGLGVPRNVETALSWYELGARNGNRDAAFQAGILYLDGLGVEKNQEKAARYFEQAAEKGHVLALYNVGLLYLSGDVLEKNPEKAADALLKSAKLGNHDAQFAIATMHSEGKGVAKDEILATLYFGQAARGGHDTAEIEYATRLLKGIGIKSNPHDAALWFERAAERGNAIAQNRIAQLYRFAKGVEADPLKAATWHLISKDQGFEDSSLDAYVKKLEPELRLKAEAAARIWRPVRSPRP